LRRIVAVELTIKKTPGMVLAVCERQHMWQWVGMTAKILHQPELKQNRRFIFAGG
jgi:hypothetical protein